MSVLEELKSIYSKLEDPRIERHKKHPLLTILFIVLCSAFAGIDEWVGMEDYCEANLDFFPNTSTLKMESPPMTRLVE